jgi:MFS family permease
MPSLSHLRHAFRALRHRNFQLFWLGQGTSVIGTWMQTAAQAWLLNELTHKPLLLGFLTVTRFGPSLIIAPFAGLAAERFPRRRVVILTQTTSLVLASLLACLTLAGLIQVWHILLLALLQGCVDSVDMTVRQTFQMDLVGPEDLQSAVSLNSAAFNSARIIGPFFAGFLIEWVGEGLCFAINALSYVAVLISLFLIRVPAAKRAPSRGSAFESIAAGMRYTWNTPAIRRVMLAVALTSAIGLSANTLTPALATDILHTSAQGYTRLLLGAGVGAIMGSLFAAAISTSHRAALVNFLMLCGLGISLIGLSQCRSVALAVVCMILIGIMASVQLSTSNAFLQTAAPLDMRGRVVSLYVWIFQGLAPIGGLASGWIADRFNIPAAILWAGIICLASGAVFGATRSVTPDQTR